MANRRHEHAEDPPHDRRAVILTIVLLIILSVTMLFVMRGQLQKRYSVHTISGTSMIPTLTERDQVLVKKNVQIQRYDIITFSVDKEEGMFVKRVIG
ncbi:MAG: signal peptidase I, partial [Enterococcus hulanensis]